MLTLRRTLLQTAFMILAFTSSGCGGGSNGGDGAGGGDGASTSLNQGVPRENVVVLPADGSVSLSNVTDSGVTVSGTGDAIASLKAGSVLVSGAGRG